MEGRAPALRDLAESGRFPTFAKIVRAFEDGYDLRLDTLFELGPAALLDGLAPVVEGRPTRTPGSRDDGSGTPGGRRGRGPVVVRDTGKEETHSSPLSTYSAPGGLRQGPRTAAQ